jgi:hypothetical protein
LEIISHTPIAARYDFPVRTEPQSVYKQMSKTADPYPLDMLQRRRKVRSQSDWLAASLFHTPRKV